MIPEATAQNAGSLSEFDLPGSEARETADAGGLTPAVRRALRYGAIAAAAVLVEGLLVWAVMTAYFGMRLPAGLRVGLDLPSYTTRGKPFTIGVTVRNQGKEPFRVTAVGIDRELTKRLRLKSPEPAPAAGALRFGGTTWPYDQEVRPGGQWDFRIQAVSEKPGSLEGSVQVQVGALPRYVPFNVEVR